MYNLEREERRNQHQEGAYNKGSINHNQMEEKKREDETRNKNDIGYLKNRGEEDLIEEIVKIIKDRNILTKVVRKLEENLRESQEVGGSIEGEDD